LDLNQAATSFHITVDESNCSDAIVGSYSEELKTKVASILDVEITRIEVDDVDCIEENVVKALVRILPNDNDRRLRTSHVTSRDHALDLFYTLRDISHGKKESSRMLAENNKVNNSIEEVNSFRTLDDERPFSISSLKILPAFADQEKLRTPPTLVDEETKLMNWSLPQAASESIGGQDTAQLQRITTMQSLILEQEQMLQIREENYEEEMNKTKEMQQEMQQEMKLMLVELTVVTIACIGVAMGVFLHLWKK